MGGSGPRGHCRGSWSAVACGVRRQRLRFRMRGKYAAASVLRRVGKRPGRTPRTSRLSSSEGESEPCLSPKIDFDWQPHEVVPEPGVLDLICVKAGYPDPSRTITSAGRRGWSIHPTRTRRSSTRSGTSSAAAIASLEEAGKGSSPAATSARCNAPAQARARTYDGGGANVCASAFAETYSRTYRTVVAVASRFSTACRR